VLALWIVLAVVVVAVTASSVVLVRRRAAPPPPTSAPPTTARPSPEATTAGTVAPALRPPPTPTATPEVAPAPEAVPPEPPAPSPTTDGDTPAATGVVEAAAPADLRDRMGKTRGLFSGYLRALRGRKAVDETTWDDLEEALLRADVGVATTSALLADLRARAERGELRGPEAVVGALRQALRQALGGSGPPPLAYEEGATNVWLFVGVNGVGKTTTIGKIARRQQAEGRSVLLAAGDTFRAAAAEQLGIWAERSGVGVVRGAEGGDPSAVVFDAVQRAAARGQGLVLADTAGRLHTKVNLVEELKKIRRVADRPPGRVTEVLLVLDATTGQNGMAQARQFLEAVGVTGVVLTKLDGTAKGGIVVAIQREFGLPVKLVGIGEGPDDLIEFDADQFVDALFE